MAGEWHNITTNVPEWRANVTQYNKFNVCLFVPRLRSTRLYLSMTTAKREIKMDNHLW